MISFEHRVVSEYKIKISKVDTLAKSIMNHREPKSTEAKEASDLSDAQAKESAMTDIVCTITANAGEEGKLYGSVSPADIVENLHSQGFEVEKRDIHIPEAIRHIGEYEVTVSLYAEVLVTVKVIVIAAAENE